MTAAQHAGTRATTRRALLALTAAAVTVAPLALASTASAQTFLSPTAVCSTPAGPAPASDRGSINAVHVAQVDCGYARDIIRGTQGGTFAPAAAVNRAQMAAFLVRTLEAGGYAFEDDGESAFTDIGNVDPDLARSIRIIEDLEITIGTTATTFTPFAPVRRDAMASFLVRTANVAYASENGNDDLVGGTLPDPAFSFGDVAPGGEHTGAIQAVSELLGVTVGVSPGVYAPARPVNREQMATFVVRLLDVTELPPFEVDVPLAPVG